MAYSADKGEKLLEVQTGRTGMAPPITYEIDGKQYVALMGGMGGARRGGRRAATRLNVTQVNVRPAARPTRVIWGAASPDVT
jgi:hypothetical protein